MNQVCLATLSLVQTSKSVAKFQSMSVLSEPWLTTAIGNPIPGFSRYKEGQFGLIAAGSGIQGTSDSGMFVCQPLSRDGSISA